jgi:hypothetical protein
MKKILGNKFNYKNPYLLIIEHNTLLPKIVVKERLALINILNSSSILEKKNWQVAFDR